MTKPYRLPISVATIAIAALAQINTATSAEITLVPLRASGVEGVDWNLGPAPNEITLSDGGQQVEVQVFVSDFGPQTIATYEITTDCASLPASGQGKATVIDVDCTIGEGTFGVDFCLGVDVSEPSYLMAPAGNSFVACQSATLCPNGDPGEFACGVVAITGDSGPDGGGTYYAGTFSLDVTVDARGKILFSLLNDPLRTYLRDPAGDIVPVDSISPSLITIPFGACCGVDGFPLQCADNVTILECSSLAGAFLPNLACSGEASCEGGLDATCPSCLSNEECDDGDACTTDTCAPDGCCTNQDDTPAGECCDPVSGTLTTIDDGNACTIDSCNPDGTVDHDADDGATCNDGDDCTIDDVCVLDSCEGSFLADVPGVAAIGSKFLSVTAEPSGSSSEVALLVTSPDWACLSKYINADGQLQDTPVVRPISDWGTILVTGEDIVPESTYEVSADCGGSTTAAGTAQTGLYADINESGAVNLEDVQLVVFGFQSDFSFNTLEEMDIWPCTPNGVINFEDIQHAVLAFQLFDYASFGCPLPCP